MTVRETAQIYKDVVEPHFVEKQDLAASCRWLYAILDHEKEQESILHETDSFMLQKDYKFDEGDITTLYCLAFPK